MESWTGVKAAEGMNLFFCLCVCVCRCGVAFCSRTGVEFECGTDLFSEWDS